MTADGANSSTASNGPSTPGARLRRRHVLALLGLGAIALTGVAVWVYARWAHVTENDARVRADMITISSRVDGWVSARPVTDGEKIRSGELLVVIDQREAALRLAELRAKLESTRLQREARRHPAAHDRDHRPDAVAAAKARREAVEAEPAVGRLPSRRGAARLRAGRRGGRPHRLARAVGPAADPASPSRREPSARRPPSSPPPTPRWPTPRPSSATSTRCAPKSTAWPRTPPRSRPRSARRRSTSPTASCTARSTASSTRSSSSPASTSYRDNACSSFTIPRRCGSTPTSRRRS